MGMFKMLMMGGFAALMLTLAAPQMTRALRMEQHESALVSQITRDTSPAALQSPGADGRLAALAHKLLALVGGDDAAPQPAVQAPQWVPVDDYAEAVATVQAPAPAP